MEVAVAKKRVKGIPVNPLVEKAIVRRRRPIPKLRGRKLVDDPFSLNQMAKYFLDTHVFYDFLTDDKDLDKRIKESIANPKPKDIYVVSDFVMLEIIQLKQLGKITLQKGLKGLMELMADYKIRCDKFDNAVWFKLDEIPMPKINKAMHSDPFDRVIIAHCIQNKYTCISADSKFPAYREFGLDLIEVS